MLVRSMAVSIWEVSVVRLLSWHRKASKKVECLEYPELGMEAIWKIEVENFPAFILVDDKGNDFFKQLKPRCSCSK